jgi:hypothetical protein
MVVCRDPLAIALTAAFWLSWLRHGSTLFRNCMFSSLRVGARHVSYDKTTEIEQTVDKERDADC